MNTYKILMILVSLFYFTEMTGQSQNENYTQTILYTKQVKEGQQSTVDRKDKIETVQYYDRLGRPKQTIQVQAGGQHQDIVTLTGYDEFGKLEKEYLPYATTSGNGNFFNGAVGQQASFYNTAKYENTTNPYSEYQYERSPFNRVREVAAPGSSWMANEINDNTRFDDDQHYDNDHTIKTNWRTNKADEVVWFVVETVDRTPSLVKHGYFVEKSLMITITKDENWQPGDGHLHTTREYKNNRGQVVLKRTFVEATGDEIEALDTYYVYDLFDNLTYVIPPKVTVADGVSANELSELCYQYKYDQRNRLIEKKIPGKGWEYIVYNIFDQPIMTQDANMRKENSGKTVDEWLFTKYDIYGRITYTGLVRNDADRASLQGSANQVANTQYEQKSESYNTIAGTQVYYSTTATPIGNSAIYTINYYDNYTFDIAGLSLPDRTVFGTSIINHNNSTTTQYQTKGMPTGTKVRVLGTGYWITSLMGYDSKGRVIYAASKNEYLNTVDIVETQYDFTGNVLKTKARHVKGTNPEIVTLDTFTYDHMNRLISHNQCIGDDSLEIHCGNYNADTLTNPEYSDVITEGTDISATQSIVFTEGFSFTAGVSNSLTAMIVTPEGEVISKNTYDELGRLEFKEVGGFAQNAISGGLQQVDYTYNIRGWLKKINEGTTANGDLFGFAIDYDSGTNPLYNGNIAKTSWKTANDNMLRHYDYTYDALNRITGATGNTANYNLSGITYDKNGNIESLTRNGWQGGSNYTNMDILDYDYDTGNKLLKVVDSGNIGHGFKDNNVPDNDYDYDVNGNMTQDNNKRVSDITYNHLNLPTGLEITPSSSTGFINYVYDATGNKLEKIVTTSGGVSKTQYAGNFVYKNSAPGAEPVLSFFNHPEGYIEPENDGTFTYIYQYKDHLGNIRLSYSDKNGDGDIDVIPGSASSEILEEKNYYPFGLQHKGYNDLIVSEHNYGFAGEEEEKELGKNTVAFQWRDYDPAIARFNKVDRFSEKYYAVTPYHFSANNPIFFREINGDSIQGVSRKSARRVKREIRKSFKNNKKLARLFKKRGNKFKGISQQDFDDATQNSSADEKALAQGYFDAVNSPEIHTVEVVKRGEKFKSALSNQFGDYNGDGKINGADADDRTGGGFNFQTGTGSHTVIVSNSTIPITDYKDNITGNRILNRTSSAGELLAHELLGHGLTNYNAGGSQFLNAIQLTNLYHRVTTGSSRYYRDGSSHGGNPHGRNGIPGTISWQVPLYLR